MGDFNYPAIDWDIQCAKKDNPDEQTTRQFNVTNH